MSSEGNDMDLRESFLNSTNQRIHPLVYEAHDAGEPETEACRFVMTPDWPQLESPEFKELVLSIIATAIRLNPFQGTEGDGQRPPVKSPMVPVVYEAVSEVTTGICRSRKPGA